MEEDGCSICLDPLAMDTLHLPCGHIFHVKCILTYATSCVVDKKEIVCPLCRHVLIPIDQVVEPTIVETQHQQNSSSSLSKKQIARIVGSVILMASCVYGFNVVLTLTRE